MTLQIGERNFRVMAIADARDRLHQLNFGGQLSAEQVFLLASGLPDLLQKDACLVETISKDEYQSLVANVDGLAGLWATVKDIENGLIIADESQKQSLHTKMQDHALQIRSVTPIIHTLFRQEVETMPVCLVTPRRIRPEMWGKVRELFKPDESAFDALPELARRDFQEAAWCYLFDQFTACAIMAMRAAEACLRYFIWCVAEEKFNERDNWHRIVEKINGLNLNPPMDERFFEKLENGNNVRNRYAHPGLRVETSDLNETEHVFDTAKMIAIYTYKDLARRELTESKEYQSRQSAQVGNALRP